MSSVMVIEDYIEKVSSEYPDMVKSYLVDFNHRFYHREINIDNIIELLDNNKVLELSIILPDLYIYSKYDDKMKQSIHDSMVRIYESLLHNISVMSLNIKYMTSDVLFNMSYISRILRDSELVNNKILLSLKLDFQATNYLENQDRYLDDDEYRMIDIVQDFSKAIEQNTSLIFFDIGVCDGIIEQKQNDILINILIDAVKRNTHINQLKIEGSLIYGDILIELLQTNKTITSLDLHKAYIRFTDKNNVVFYRTLHNNTTLMNLSINSNIEISSFCDLLKYNSTLTSLNLHKSYICNTDHFTKRSPNYNSLSHNSTLTSLNISSIHSVNSSYKTFMKCILTNLRSNTTLTSLNIKNNRKLFDITRNKLKYRLYLEDFLKNNISLTELKLSGTRLYLTKPLDEYLEYIVSCNSSIVKIDYFQLDSHLIRCKNCSKCFPKLLPDDESIYCEQCHKDGFEEPYEDTSDDDYNNYGDFDD